MKHDWIETKFELVHMELKVKWIKMLEIKKEGFLNLIFQITIDGIAQNISIRVYSCYTYNVKDVKFKIKTNSNIKILK